MLTVLRVFCGAARLGQTLRSSHRCASTRPNFQLGLQMKQLNEKNQHKQALTLFDAIEQREMSDIAINQAIQACIHLQDFCRGSAIHQQHSLRAMNSSYIQKSLVELYTRHGDVAAAQRIFSSVPANKRTLFLYTAMFTGLVRNQRNKEALALIKQMTVQPNSYICTKVFSLCADLNTDTAKQVGRQLFAQMTDSDRNDTATMNAAVHMFATFGDLHEAEKVFESIKTKNSISYGAMLKGYNLNNEPLKALELFWRKQREGVEMNVVEFVLVVKSCAEIGFMDQSRAVAARIPQHFLHELVLQNALIDMWGKSSLPDEAERVFRTIQLPDSVSFGAMINAFGLNGMGSRAVNVYKQVPRQLRNSIVDLCVLNACSHSGLLDDARAIFASCSPKTEKMTTVMVDCLSRLHRLDEAEQLLIDFERAHPPSPMMYQALMSGARTREDSNLSERLRTRMIALFPHLKGRLVSASILLANTFSATEKKERARQIKEEIRQSSVRPQVGESCTSVDGQIVKFRAHDRSHPRSTEIYDEINRFIKELIACGHTFDARWITRPLGPDETVESVLSGHSERLALAFNFIQKTVPTPIQITKNLRICGDCHAAIKLLARQRQRLIIIRDLNRIHHFRPDGTCSCGDQF